MLATRPVGLEIHRGIETAMGLALVILPILLGFAPGSPLAISVEAVAVAGAFGLLLATLGLVASRDGDALSPSLHRVLDVVVAAALIGATIFFAARAESRADTVVLALAAFPYALLVFFTYYEAGGPDRATTVSEESGP
jgi:Na+/H+ antiporter NhaD/arsenite permease-like protein